MSEQAPIYGTTLDQYLDVEVATSFMGAISDPAVLERVQHFCTNQSAIEFAGKVIKLAQEAKS